MGEKVSVEDGHLDNGLATYDCRDAVVNLFYCLVIGIIFEMMTLES